MKIVVTPTKEVVDRAIALGFDETDICYYGESKTVALYKATDMLKPVYYLGTVTILKHRLKPNSKYALSHTGPVYSGNLIKTVLKVLGKRRVHVFLHFKDNNKQFVVLILGTKDGTVAIAPRVYEDKQPNDLIDEETELLSDYWKGATTKLIREILFGTL